MRVLLEGGVSALAKPEEGIADGPIVVRREVAAWLFARELGWPDLVACTVLRDVPLASGGTGLASVQLLWPDSAIDDHDLNAYSEEDVWRAAIFDVIIAHSDRGHNWLGLPEASGGYRLKLVDHGYSFDHQGFQSAFYERLKGEAIPSEHQQRLQRCQHLRHEGHLRELFGADLQPLEDAISRAKALDDSGGRVPCAGGFESGVASALTW